jgi:hypothetical protein
MTSPDVPTSCRLTKKKGDVMSIDGVETFRGAMQGRTPDGYDSTVIVLRRGEGYNGRVWLTFNGAIKTTVVMTDAETTELVELLDGAQRAPRERLSGRPRARRSWSHGDENADYGST